MVKDKLLGTQKDAIKSSKNFSAGRNLELGGKKFDRSKVVDLDAEENEELLNDEEEVFFEEPEEDEEGKEKGKKVKKERKKKLSERNEIEEEAFKKEYMRVGGIQHIICSATMTIDNKGRITPRS